MPSKTTRKSRALKLRRKLKKETSTKRKYITKYKDIKDYFKLLNNALFNGKLSPFGQVEIKELKWQMHLMDCKLKSCEQWRNQTIERMTDEKSNT